MNIKANVSFELDIKICEQGITNENAAAKDIIALAAAFFKIVFFIS